MDVDVLDYDKAQNKFLVRVCTNDQQKWIRKLSLRFNFENKTLFHERLNMAKGLYMRALDDQRFMQYIQNMPMESVRALSEAKKESLVAKAGANSQDTRSINKLLDEVGEQYNAFNKKSVVLKEMSRAENAGRFEEKRIQLRDSVKDIPMFGSINGEITKYQYLFNKQKD